MKTIRPAEKALAARLILAKLTADEDMFNSAIEDALTEPHPSGSVVATLAAVAASLATDLAGIMTDVSGAERATEIIRTALLELAWES